MLVGLWRGCVCVVCLRRCVFLPFSTMRESRGGGGGRGSRAPPLEKSQNIGFLSNTGPDPLTNYKAAKPVCNVGPHRYASEMQFKWHLAGGPLMAHL